MQFRLSRDHQGPMRSTLFLALAAAALMSAVACSETSVADNEDQQAGGEGGVGGSEEPGGMSGSAEGGKGGAKDDPAAPAGGEGGGGTAGQAGGGAPGNGGGTPAPAGSSDKAREKIWFDGDVKLGGSTPVQASHPDNWFEPNNYWEGQILVRLNVAMGIPDVAGIEMCIAKASADDPKHTCPNLISGFKGEGEFTKKNLRANAMLLNVLSKATMDENDFKSTFAVSTLRLVKDHFTELPGPVEGHMTIVLVPKGLEFSGWSNYPK